MDELYSFNTLTGDLWQDFLNKLGFWFPILIETSRYNVCVR